MKETEKVISLKTNFFSLYYGSILIENSEKYNLICEKNIDASPYQTREMPSELELQPLISSIRDKGVIQPIIVRSHPSKKGRYELIAGQRRVLASRFLGRKTIKAIIIDIDDAGAAELCLTENAQREQLSPLEEARGFKILKDLGYSILRISKIVGKSRPYVANSLRLLNLDHFVQLAVLHKTLTPWHGRIILSLPEGFEQYRLADLVMDWSLSVEELKQIVSNIKECIMWVHWTRDVPISGLYEFKAQPPSPREDVEILESMKRHGQLKPISVTTSGMILNGHRRVRVAKKLEWEMIRADVCFAVDWLRQSSHESSTQFTETTITQRGICPKMTEEQQLNIKNFCQALSKYCDKRTSNFSGKLGNKK